MPGQSIRPHLPTIFFLQRAAMTVFDPCFKRSLGVVELPLKVRDGSLQPLLHTD